MITIGGNDMDTQNMNNNTLNISNTSNNGSNLGETINPLPENPTNQSNLNNNQGTINASNVQTNNTSNVQANSNMDNQTVNQTVNQVSPELSNLAQGNNVSLNTPMSKKANQDSKMVAPTQPDNAPKEVKKPNPSKEKTSFFTELFLSILNIFYLAYRGISYPLSQIFNASSKTVDDAYQQAKLMNNKKPKKNDDLDVIIKKIKDFLGITQKEVLRLEEERRKLQLELQQPEASIPDKAKVYRYKIKNLDGKIEYGNFTALTKMDVNSFLLNEGVEVYKIENNKWIDFIYGDSSMVGSKWSTKDLIFWLTQLSTYIKAGITLNDAIKILINQYNKQKDKKITMQAIAYELTMGNSFSQALEKQGTKFPPLLINMLKAAEATGDLESTLDDMANYYTEMETTKKQMINAMTYPTIVIIFAIAVVCFIILYVVPQFEDIYSSNGVQIKGMTAIVLAASGFLKTKAWILALGIIVAIIAFVMAYKRVKAFRKSIQITLMHIPVVKNIIIYNEIAIFTKTFASLLKNNVYITQSVEILSKITNNEIYKDIMYNTINNIVTGDKISKAFKNHWAVPDVAYNMIVTGESTGELAEMMDRVSHYYQEQHASMVNNIKSFIEPLTIVFLAVVVGAIIISILVPMFDMYNNVSGGSM